MVSSELKNRNKTEPLIYPNDSYEAYTGNHVSRKGTRTPLKQFSLVTIVKAVGQGVMLSEANTKEPNLRGSGGSCRGLRAWHVWREM